MGWVHPDPRGAPRASAGLRSRKVGCGCFQGLSAFLSLRSWGCRVHVWSFSPAFLLFCQFPATLSASLHGSGAMQDMEDTGQEPGSAGLVLLPGTPNDKGGCKRLSERLEATVVVGWAAVGTSGVGGVTGRGCGPRGSCALGFQCISRAWFPASLPSCGLFSTLPVQACCMQLAEVGFSCLQSQLGWLT